MIRSLGDALCIELAEADGRPGGPTGIRRRISRRWRPVHILVRCGLIESKRRRRPRMATEDEREDDIEALSNKLERLGIEKTCLVVRLLLGRHDLDLIALRKAILDVKARRCGCGDKRPSPPFSLYPDPGGDISSPNGFCYAYDEGDGQGAKLATSKPSDKEKLVSREAEMTKRYV